MAEKKVTINNLAEMIQRGFLSVDKRFLSVDKRFLSVDKRFDAIDKRFDAIDKRFDDIDKRFDRIEKLIIADHKRRIERLEIEMKDLKELLAIR